jgi:hypothetical protein
MNNPCKEIDLGIHSPSDIDVSGSISPLGFYTPYVPLKPLCYVEDVKIAVYTAFQNFYDNQEKYTNLKQLMELVYEEFRKIQTYTPEFASRSKQECEEYIQNDSPTRSLTK